MKPRLTTEQEIDILKLKKDGVSNSNIIKKYNISQGCLTNIIKRNGREHLISNKRYEVDQNYFENIDDQDKAYWLGFLYADGYVRMKYGRSGHLKIRLKNTEIDHLKLFNKCLKSNYPIKNDILSKVKVDGREHISLCCDLHIYNTKLVKDLFKWGCVNKKSMIIEFPTFLNDELMRHFIRGYFDGDGCFSYQKKNQCISFVSGSLNFIKDLDYYLKKNILKVENNINFEEKRFYTLNYTTQSFFIEFYKFIYENANLCLKRKKNKFDNYIKEKSHTIIDMFDKNGRLIKSWNHINNCSKDLQIGTKNIMKMIRGEMENKLNLRISSARNFDDTNLIESVKIFKFGDFENMN